MQITANPNLRIEVPSFLLKAQGKDSSFVKPVACKLVSIPSIGDNLSSCFLGMGNLPVGLSLKLLLLEKMAVYFFS